jgi:non-specific protein-tyrosine kinase
LVDCLNAPSCPYSLPSSPVKIVRLDQAGPPDQPTGVRPRLNALGGGVLGLVLGVVLAILVEYLDDVLRTPSDLRRSLGWPVVVRLPGGGRRVGEGRGLAEGGGMTGGASRLTMVAAPQSPVAEAYRLLRTNLLFGQADQPLRSLLVVGVGEERASDVVANLAVAVAQAGRATTIVDAHLRAPEQHRLFGLINEAGLAEALSAGALPAPQPTGVVNLRLLVAGSAPALPAELLGGERLGRLLRQLAEGDGLVILDAPPIGQLADGPIVAGQVDGVIVVIRAGKTRRARALEAKETLERIGARLLGTVLIEG